MEDTVQHVHESHDLEASVNGRHDLEGSVNGLVTTDEDKPSNIEISEMVEAAKKASLVLVLHLNDSFSGHIDLKRAKVVAIALLNVIRFINKMNEDKRMTFVNDLLIDQDKSFIAELGVYFMHHWIDKKPCSDPLCDQLTHLTCCLLTTLSDMSHATKAKIVEMGITSTLLRALVKLKDVSFSDVVQSKALSTLILLGNCSEKAIQYHEFDNARGVIKILTPYLKSTESRIRMAAHAVAVHLGIFLSGDDISKLSLTQTEVDELVKTLKAAIGNTKLTSNVFGVSISAEEILSQLDLSLVAESNLSLLLESDVLNIIPSILKVDHVDTVKAAISFIWTITSHVIIMDGVSSELQLQLLMACPSLENISTTKNMNSDLAECTLLALQPDLLKDIDSALKYIKNCYNHNRFAECIHVANRFKEPSALLYKAKCLFKIYRRALNLYELEKQQNIQQYLSILKDAKAAVSMLGTALDKNSIDKEGKEQLDIAMVNVIRGLNELYKVIHPHCMLCLRTDVSLQKSHVYPKSLLKVIADTTEEREGGKVFTMANALSPKWHYHYSSPKDVRYYMLCSHCEDVVNKGGENDFFQAFFSQLYDRNGPCRPTKETTVAYGPWLYHFCISLVFRCIAAVTGIPELVNKHEIYNLFLKCRKFLLSSEEPCDDTLPSVYFFINPNEVPNKYEHCCLQEALTSPGFCTIQTTDLSEGLQIRPLKGHYIMAHCGIINVLLKFSPADEVSIPCNWEINPQGGEYTIPAEINKDKDIPEGIWTAFEQVSKSFYDHIMKSLFRKKDKPPDVKKSRNSTGVECQSPKQPAWSTIPQSYLDNPESISVINMLPPGFEIDCFSGKVILPQGFILLIHSTFVSATSDEANITLLIGVKECAKAKNLDKLVPFVVLCRFASIGACFVGYSVNFEKDICHFSNLCETDLIQNSDEIQLAEKDAKIFVRDSLPAALKEKGFVNLKSLIYNHIHNPFISSLDIKCPMPLHCWYCKDFCENCLSSSGFGRELMGRSNSGISLKFCSHACAQYFMGPNKKPMLLNIEIFPPKNQDDCEVHVPIPILQITGSGKMNADEGVLVTCLICRGHVSEEHPNGRFFIHCQLRSLFNQKVIEMFVSEKGVPEQPLPHADCPFGHEMVRSFEANGNIYWIITSALQNIFESVDTKSKEVELNLHAVAKFHSFFFEDKKRATESVKLCDCKMAIREPFNLDNIHGLIQKMSALQDNIFSQRKVNLELTSSIKRLLCNLQQALSPLPKDNEELFRLLHCCFNFLTESIRGLQHCRDEMCLSVAGGLLNEVWITSIKIIVHTSRQESCKQSLNELVSTLMDYFAMSTKLEDKSDLSYQDMLLQLLCCCAKSDIFREFVSIDNLSIILQPLLNKHGSGARVFALLFLSFFISDGTPEEHKRLLELEVLDIQLLNVNLVMNVVTVADALHLIKTSIHVPSNIPVLRSCDFQTIASQFIDEDPEGKLAVEIINALQTFPEESTIVKPIVTIPPDELLKCILPILIDYNRSAAAENCFDSESCIVIQQKLQDLTKVLQKNSTQQLASIPKYMLETTAREFSLYFRLHLLDVDDRHNPKLIQILHSCGIVLIDICRFTPSYQVHIIKEKLASKLLTALEKFNEHENPSEDILARIVLCLILLHLCLKEAIKQHVFINAHVVASVLLKYYRTSYLAVWMFAKLSMMHLGEFLDIKIYEVLELTEEALTEFVSNLSEGTNPFSLIQVFGGAVTGNEILTFLEEATLLEKNSMRMLNVGLLQCFPELLQNSDSQTKAARLLWALAQRPAIRQKINQEAPLLQQIIEQFIMDSSSDILQLLSMCLKGVETQDFSNILKYAEGCYKHSMLTECVTYCEHLLSQELAPEHIKDASRVFLAKSQFKQYRRQQQLLSMKPYADQEFISLHDTCYGLARKVVQSFKIVTQKSGFKVDEESLKVFYISLMDISREGIESLKKFHYCLLCKRNKMELQHSHIIPKAILECFTASMGQTVGKRVFKAINYPRKKRFRYFASKELAFYVFCKECENIFNDRGEKGFLSFFKEIYNSDDSGTLEKQHKLVYGEWLYHFCISLIFRGIGTSIGIPDYMESDEVYQCFLKCRRFLLNEYTLDSPELPEIFLLFNPTTVPTEYELQVLNQVLISPGFFFCDNISLSDGLPTEPPIAQFMIAHIGILNILVTFTTEPIMLDEHKIIPSGGTCTVPHDSERTLPNGIWKMFCSLSSDYRREMQESFFHKQDKVPVPIETVETESEVNTQKAFKLVSARMEDSQRFADQCQQESLAMLNLLPETFKIVKESSVVSLPSDHHLLLHFHTTAENDQGSTALIGLYAKKGQPIKPFTIHYQFSPTTVFCVGFYLTQAGEVEKLICDSSLEEYPSVKTHVEAVKNSIPISLPAILNAKGFVNMESLIYHFEHSTFECPLDTKCPTYPRCWYCRGRCENCLKRAATLEPLSITVSKVPLKFCGEDCQAVFCGPRNSPIRLLSLATRRSHNDTEKIEEGHSEICCMAGQGIVDGEGLRFKISVRVGYQTSSNPKGRYYCIFNCRTLFTQQFAELFLHIDTSPDCPLPHVNNLKGQRQVQKLRDEEALQGFIQTGFRAIKRQHQSNLPTSTTQEAVTEEIPALSVRTLVASHKELYSDSIQEGKNLKDKLAPSSVLPQLSESEKFYENFLRLHIPDLPSIHALNDLLPEDLIKSIAQSWKKFISSKEVCLESNISQILTQGIEFLLQVTDGIQVPLAVMDATILLFYKLLQHAICRESTDLSLIQSVMEPALSMQNSLSRIYAMMILSSYMEQNPEEVKKQMKLTKEDIEVISILANCEEEICDVLSFLEQAIAIEHNSHKIRSFGGLELLGKVIEIFETEDDSITTKAALLLDTLLREET